MTKSRPRSTVSLRLFDESLTQNVPNLSGGVLDSRAFNYPHCGKEIQRNARQGAVFRCKDRVVALGGGLACGVRPFDFILTAIGFHHCLFATISRRKRESFDGFFNYFFEISGIGGFEFGYDKIIHKRVT